jgi:hypothetical protein
MSDLDSGDAGEVPKINVYEQQPMYSSLKYCSDVQLCLVPEN